MPAMFPIISLWISFSASTKASRSRLHYFYHTIFPWKLARNHESGPDKTNRQRKLCFEQQIASHFMQENSNWIVSRASPGPHKWKTWGGTWATPRAMNMFELRILIRHPMVTGLCKVNQRLDSFLQILPFHLRPHWSCHQWKPHAWPFAFACKLGSSPFWDPTKQVPLALVTIPNTQKWTSQLLSNRNLWSAKSKIGRAIPDRAVPGATHHFSPFFIWSC